MPKQLNPIGLNPTQLAKYRKGFTVTPKIPRQIENCRKKRKAVEESSGRKCQRCGKVLLRGEVRCTGCNHRNDRVMSLDETVKYLAKAKQLMQEKQDKKA